MFDPESDAFILVVLGLVLGGMVILGGLALWLPNALARRRLDKLERDAAAGDPEAIRGKRFLEQFDQALQAGGAADEERRRRLRADGLPDRATIRAVRVGSTRVERGGSARRPVTLELALHADGRELEVVEWVDELYVGRLLVGADVPVFLDPADPEQLIVAWDTV